MTNKTQIDIGLNFIVGLAGSNLSEYEKQLLTELRPSGIIIFKHNIARNCSEDWIPQLLELILEVKQCISRDSLIVSIDHEGGLVHRFPEPVTRFCAALDLRESAFDVAKAMAAELRALSFNTTYSPVLDIHSCSSNPVIGKRAFGTTSDEVINYSKKYLAGLNEVGIISCGKHFPGHGDTKTDSHLELPILDVGLDVLAGRELLPFRDAILNQIPMIMTAHVMYPQLDNEYPATLSKNIISNLLRQELGFKGVVVSDDLFMKALGQFSNKKVAVTGIKAGLDILLCGNAGAGVSPLDKSKEMANALSKTALEDEALHIALESAQNRVKTLLKQIGRLEAKTARPSTKTVGCQAHIELCASLAKAAITRT